MKGRRDSRCLLALFPHVEFLHVEVAILSVKVKEI